jgi:tetratricopeptide (TPR) repeat protein
VTWPHFDGNPRILWKKRRDIKPESKASDDPFGYSAAVPANSHGPISRSAKAFLGGSLVLACAACAATGPKPDSIEAPQVFYTVTGEIALARREPRIAATQYAAAASLDEDPKLLARATEVTAQTLQPSLTQIVAARWMIVEPGSLDAQRAAARAALALDRISPAASLYRGVLVKSPQGTEAEFAELEAELAEIDNIYGARRLADQLAVAFPDSLAALRMQGFAALRADDPAAATKSFSSALALGSGAPDAPDGDARREIRQGLWRARILSGDAEEPLAQAQALAERDPTPANQLDYSLLLLAARKNAAAIAQLESLAHSPESGPVALHLLGLVEFQDGQLDAAGRRFTELLTLGKFVDDSFYYLGLIAERRGDLERALRLYAQVQGGENAVPALLRACRLLQANGGGAMAQELYDKLIDEEPQRAPEILAARARIFSESGDAAQALDVLDGALRQYPDSVDIRYAIASTYEDQGQIAQALRELKQVLATRPDDPAALNAYGYTLADHNRELAHARTLIERAYAASPKNPAILDSMGWVLYRQGQAAQAVPLLTAAYADDRGGDIAAHLGEVLWAVGRRPEAEQIWSEAFALEPDNRLLRETRQRLHATK